MEKMRLRARKQPAEVLHQRDHSGWEKGAPLAQKHSPSALRAGGFAWLSQTHRAGKRQAELEEITLLFLPAPKRGPKPHPLPEGTPGRGHCEQPRGNTSHRQTEPGEHLAQTDRATPWSLRGHLPWPLLLHSQHPWCPSTSSRSPLPPLRTLQVPWPSCPRARAQGTR